MMDDFLHKCEKIQKKKATVVNGSLGSETASL